MKWWAHRGAGVSAPENTLDALQLGYDLGFRAVEFDTMLTRDGVAVLHHDWTIGRTSKLTSNPILGKVKANAAINTLTHTQVSALDAGSWHSAPYVGLRVPLLSEALALCEKLALAVNLELKSPANAQPDQLAKTVMDCISALDYSDHAALLVSSFDVLSLYAMRAAQYRGPMALLFEQLPDDWITHALKLDAVAIHLSSDHVTESQVRRIHTAQRRVRVYTVNGLEQAKRMFDMGVDGLFTDNMTLPTTYESEKES